MKISGTPYQTAQLGIRRGLQQLDQAATDIARGDLDLADQSQAMVALMEGRQQVETSVKVMKFADQMFSALLDLKPEAADRRES